jgi:poly-D-alanine transfer protein DltD
MRFAEHRMCLAGRHHAAVDHDHLSIAGWMYYDEVLDAFFHDRPKLLAARTR